MVCVLDNPELFYEEQMVLGSIIAFPQKFGNRLSRLSRDLFTTEEHIELFDILIHLESKYPAGWDDSMVLDQIAASDGEVKVEYCHCYDRARRTAPMDNLIRDLYNAAKERYMNRATAELFSGFDPPTAEQIKAIADHAINAYSYIEAETGEYQDFIDKMDEPVDVIHTQFRKLDNLLDGIRQGTLTIIGARPSVGKTTFSLNIAQNVAGYGRKVAYFTLEMTRDMIIEKLISRGMKVDYKGVRQNINPADTMRFFEETGLTENLRIIDNISTVEDICDYITREKLDLAVVDYVQIVETLKKEDTVRTKIDYISGRLKQAAKRSKCRVILLSQLKRPESGIVKPPTMNDLKESSGLEQDGDYIIMLYRPYVQDKSFTEAGGYKYKPYESAALLEKNKFGFIGECKLFFDGAHQDFREAT